MTSPIDPLRAEELLGELAWIRRLARRLVDSQAADDVAQETMLVALSRQSEPTGERRAWLSRVARNMALKWRRGSARRSEREQLVAPPPAVEPAHEPLVRAEVHEYLVREVMQLDEAYRSVLLLRYLEECSPTEIATRLGIPASTVRTRLARGLEQLRARLDDGHGRERWMAALAPLAAEKAVGGALLASTLMTKKKLVLVLGSVAVLIGGSRWLEPPPTPVQPPSPIEEVASLTDLDTAARSELDEPGVPTAIREPLPPVEPRADRDMPAGWPIPVTVRFHLILDDGTALEDLDGTVELQIWHDARYDSHGNARSGRLIQEEVVDGVCEFESEPAESGMRGASGWEWARTPAAADARVELELKNLSLGGGPAVPVLARGTGEAPHFPLGSRPLVIDVERPFEMTLNVRDAHDARHLDGVRAVYFPPGLLFGLDFSETRPSKPAFAERSSPIRYLPPLGLARSKRVTFHVHAPGYRWTRVILNPQKEGEHEVLLERGGMADVLIEGSVDDQTYLVVWDGVPNPERRPHRQLRVIEQLAADTVPIDTERNVRLLLEGLALGEQTLELTDGQEGPVLGSAVAHIRADEPASVTLEIDPNARPRLAELGGSLWLAPHWRRQTEKMTIEATSGEPFARPRIELALDDMSTGSDDSGLLFWNAGQVMSGSYAITLDNLPVGLLVDLGPEGLDDVHLEVPEPAQVSIEVVDEVTGLPLEDDRIFWSVGYSNAVSLQRTERTGRFELAAPIGPIRVGHSARSYLQTSEVLEVHAGRNTHTLRARAASQLGLMLVDGKDRVPSPVPITELRIERPDGSRPEPGGFGREEGFEILYLEPGVYTLELPEIPGYRPIPPREIELVPFETLSLLIELVRD